MYLAPLNYDRYFKKVFSDSRIAKRFLEDFFDVQIEELTILPARHKITDDASAVEFDFRCKIEGQMVIIDMQQWFKPDIVKRFYLYHAMNTVLQLEKMPSKSLNLGDEKKRDAKDYNSLVPVITLIWLSDDNLNFEEDFVTYTMSQEALQDFVRNKNLWSEENILELMRERERHLSALNNRTKQLDFLQKNKLIYAFQPNIVKNGKYSKYLAWFELASKTRNKNNEKAWFDEYLKDDVFSEIIRRISTESFGEADWEYISEQENFQEKVKRYDDALLKEGFEEGVQKGIYETARNGIKAGLDNAVIALMTKLTDEQINKIRNDLTTA